ncbi:MULTISPECIES: transglutaminase family protein [unclassified Synechococcus]|uniref:transglutaminase-like domain-containing protein n=1 Tax=unclassified Synechococcus TaxID=2626047 RepID=UPI0021A35FBF|nr:MULTISPECIES: transglutaminase family protein [unclassified Synechococcus]MCT0212692.1 transglutaminase family protein [Synechococcus sp. CS-1326]MCT0233700.1 transglutaminase family protein [Synechococcus sp. CS-1327]
MNEPSPTASWSPTTPPAEDHLASSAIVDWHTPVVRSLARQLGDGTQLQVAERCFLWVRDRVRHSFDIVGAGPTSMGTTTATTATAATPVTCTASKVLERRSGICFAKSHLLAALLRANGIPAGFGYQRLCLNDSGPPFVLHGFNWVALPGFGWHPLDARGDREGVATRFEPPAFSLAYSARLPGERTDPQVFAEPLAAVVTALRQAPDLVALRHSLPDWQP